LRVVGSLLPGEADSLAHYRIAKRGLSGTTEYCGQFEPESYLEDDPTRLIPELLDRLAELGDLAKQVSRALGGNGHRKAEVASLIKELKRQG
jgi:alkylation response protein AidB-like acyl-CoA dehydrogenase